MKYSNIFVICRNKNLVKTSNIWYWSKSKR